MSGQFWSSLAGAGRFRRPHLQLPATPDGAHRLRFTWVPPVQLLESSLATEIKSLSCRVCRCWSESELWEADGGSGTQHKSCRKNAPMAFGGRRERRARTLLAKKYAPLDGPPERSRRKEVGEILKMLEQCSGELFLSNVWVPPADSNQIWPNSEHVWSRWPDWGQYCWPHRPNLATGAPEITPKMAHRSDFRALVARASFP